MINYRQLRDWRFPTIEHSYTADDTMRYALALGLGENPVDEHQLRFVNDVRPGMPLALPTMAVVLGYPGSWMAAPELGIDFATIVHGEEEITLHGRLQASGTVISRHRVVRVVDKGPGRGATITYDKDLLDRDSGHLLATVTHTTFARGDGGFATADIPGDPAPPPPQGVPRREPDRIIEYKTLPQQALLYRLSADRNPLHSDPDAAQAAGFDRPILHGLCTYGLAGRAVLAAWCDHEPQRLKRLFARFTAPVYPGETLRFETYRDGDTVLFCARAKDGIGAEPGRIVLDFGRAVIEAADVAASAPSHRST